MVFLPTGASLCFPELKPAHMDTVCLLSPFKGAFYSLYLLALECEEMIILNKGCKRPQIWHLLC